MCKKRYRFARVDNSEKLKQYQRDYQASNK